MRGLCFCSIASRAMSCLPIKIAGADKRNIGEGLKIFNKRAREKEPTLLQSADRSLKRPTGAPRQIAWASILALRCHQECYRPDARKPTSSCAPLAAPRPVQASQPG